MAKETGTQTIRTPRLILRKFRTDDSPAMYRNWATDEKTIKYLSWDTHESENLTRALLSQWIENYKSSEYYNWAMEYEGEVIGSISIVRQSKDYYSFKEFGYCMGSRWWNMGLMSEAVSALVDHFFRETNTHRLVIRHAVENIGSGKVAEKSGFTREGIERGAYVTRDGQYMDIVVHSLLKSEWERMGTCDRLILETPRLRLRPMTAADFDAVHAYAGSQENTRYMLWGTNTKAETRAFLRMCERTWAQDTTDSYNFAIEDRDTGSVIGGCSIDTENGEGCLGWILHRDRWNRGITTEAGAAMMRYGFETLGLHRIYATCDTNNIGSYRVMEKLGMKREGTFRKNRFYHNTWHDEHHYAILKEEWEEQHAEACEAE